MRMKLSGVTSVRVRLAALLMGVLLALAMAAPAMAAPGAKHGSCARFGHAFAAWAQGELPPEAGTPGTVMPVLARTEPGYVAFVLHSEMVEELEDFPGTPYCDAHPTK
ncbi:MAG: hypothetical protein R6U94_04110 [Nitriliruptoraceae bacterium]